MKKLSPMEQDAKLKVLQELMDDMDGSMSDSLDAKKKMKATVIASSPKGLKEGLEKAEDVVEGQMPEMEDEEEMEGEEDEMESEDEEMSPEEIKAKIAELQSMLSSKKSDVKMPF